MALMETRGPRIAGDWKITQLVEWEGEAFPASRLYPDIPLEAVRTATPAGAAGRLTAGGSIITSTQCFLLESKHGIALVEMGIGNDKDRPDEPYWHMLKTPYLETLASLGVQPEDVDYVFLSHLHPDHVGLATSRRGDTWAPTFPRAQYVIHPREWEYWDRLPHRHPCIDDSVRPLVDAGRVRWAADGEVIAGVTIHDAPGHSPGHLLFEIRGEDVWFLGDLFHHPAQLAHPDWPSADFDWDAARNRDQRRRSFARFASSGALLYGAHLGDAFQISSGRTGGFEFEIQPIFDRSVPHE